MKTYKREIAVVSLIMMYLFIGYTLYNLALLGQIDAMVDLVGILVIPTFATVAAAFGLDSYFKQKEHTESPRSWRKTRKPDSLDSLDRLDEQN